MRGQNYIKISIYPYLLYWFCSSITKLIEFRYKTSAQFTRRKNRGQLFIDIILALKSVEIGSYISGHCVNITGVA